MRYSELKIETQRQAPSRARSEGSGFLRRAGYIGHQNEITPLGARLEARLRELAGAHRPEGFLSDLGIPAVKTEAGEFYFKTPTSHTQIMECPACDYAAPCDLARIRKSTGGREDAVPLEKVETPECGTIDALAQYLGLPKERTAKALMYTRPSDGQFIFVVIRGDMQLSEAKLRGVVGETRPATQDEILGAGATPGYASPIGLKRGLIVVDDLIPDSPNLVAGANELGFHLKNVNFGRDYEAASVVDLVLAQEHDPCPHCGAALHMTDADLLMDRNGLRIEPLFEALAELHRDEKGLVLSAAAAPFDVYLMHLTGKEQDTRLQAAKLAADWEQAGIAVLLDDRDERAGVKFADADLIGCPVRATLGERGMKDGMVELKPRNGAESTLVSFADAVGRIQALIRQSS
jgi:prolyl-tRNA synthetase